MNNMTEDTLVQQTTTDYLHDKLGWDVVYAYNNETFGVYGTLGRKNDNEVVLTRYLKAALVKFNKDLPQQAYDDASPPDRGISSNAVSPADQPGQIRIAQGWRAGAVP